MSTPRIAQRPEELPDVCGSESQVAAALARSRSAGRARSAAPPGRLRSGFAIALHMHQPLIPAGGPDLHSAAIIGNLQHMLEHPEIKDSHNASVFLDCYGRIGRLIRELVDAGHRPRVMLDYSGCLLHGLHQMGRDDVLASLTAITGSAPWRDCVEWLGTAWGHAVAPSTPVQDYRLHVRAWQHHFASIFGLEALGRVRGYSPAEMALPNHPDVFYEFVRTLRECGYEWVLVQEHTVERAADGGPVERPHLPHRLVARNSRGEMLSMTALIKTQGSDTKLVGQMQPCFEARGLGPLELAGRPVPPLVTQIADGENGGVMMNEFPPKYMAVMAESSGTEVAPLNVSEYLDHVASLGIGPDDLPAIEPRMQRRIWDRFADGSGPAALEQTIRDLSRRDSRFHMEGGSWTNDLSWVRGYDQVLGPMERVSALFAEKVRAAGIATTDARYRRALYHLLLTQTSCFRYWGQGLWTDYGRELCRRAEEILAREF